jgi:hypothetical protein
MRGPLSLLVIAALLVVSSALEAQQSRTVGPGMTMDEVRSALGAPAIVREADGWVYFFYTNRCLPRCGTDDTVFFRDGRVVAAVLHSPSRRWAGPAAAPALGEATAAEARQPRGAGAAVTGIQVRTREPVEEPPVNLGVISGRLRDARPVEGATAQAADPATTAAEAAAPTPAPAQPADARSREPRIESNTIRRSPQR